MTRFREKKGTIAGEDREGSDVIRDGLRNFYHQNGFDPVAAGNSTKAFWRDLTAWEVKEVRAGNAAKFGKRAGGRAIPEDKRRENLEKTKKSIENGKRRRARENGDDSGDRNQIADEIADDDQVGLGPNKRVHREPREPEFAPSNIRGARGSATRNSGGSSRQGRGENAFSARTQRYGTHGAVLMQHQNPYPMAGYQQPQHFSPYNNQQYQPSYPGSGMENAVNQDPWRSSRQQGGQFWPAQSPYQTNGNFGTQRGPVQSIPWQPSPNSTYVPAHILRQTRDPENYDVPSPASGYEYRNVYDDYALPQNRRMRNEPVLEEAEYNPYVAEENRQRMLRQGRSDDMVPRRPMSNTNVGYTFPSRPTGPVVERRAPFENTNGALRPNGNTLGRDGQPMYQAPKQVLGKRGQHGAGDAVVPNQHPDPESSTPALPRVIPDADIGPSQKRQRNNGNGGPAPKPQRRRQGGKTQQKRYGPGGAPQPMLLPGQSFEALNPIIIDDEEGPLPSPAELFRDMAPVLGFYGNMGTQGAYGAGQVASAANVVTQAPAAYGNPSNGNVSRGRGHKTTSNRTEDRGTSGAPERQAPYLQRMPEYFETQQVLGERRQAAQMNQPNQDIHVSQQNPVEQGPEERTTNEREDTYVPGPKRRRIPATEGYHSPPAQAPKSQASKKSRNAERDAHLSPPQLNINERAPRVSEAPEVPQAVEENLAPQQLVTNGTLDDFHDAVEVNDALPPPTEPSIDSKTPIAESSPQVTSAQAPDPPEDPTPARSEQELPFDIRDVPPANGWQSQSLQNALNYTREAYTEWTGEDAPATNPETSFNEQYRTIHGAFQQFWSSEKNPERSHPLPELYQVEAWSGEVTNWRAPENIEHLWEPMRRGRWAARNEDGSLVEPQFLGNVEEYGWWDGEGVGRL